MDKETKDQLKQTLQMTDSKQLLKFVKSYAAKNDELAKAIIEKFMPTVDTLDIEKAVGDCFNHKKKGGRRSYGPSLDWATIRRDIKRLLKQLNCICEQGNHETAARAALHLLQTLAEEFMTDCVYEDYNYDRSDYSIDQTLQLLHTVLVKSHTMSRESKLDIIAALKEVKEERAYKSYLSCDIGKLINNAEEAVLTPEELLKQIDTNVRKTSDNADKAYYVGWKITLLHDMDRSQEAYETMDKHVNLEPIAEMKYSRLMEEENYEAAKAFCQDRIDFGKSHNRSLDQWYKRWLDVATLTNDKAIQRETAKWLFLNVNISKDAKEYYYTYRQTFSDDVWPQYRDSLLSLKEKKSYDKDLLLGIYEEEGLHERIFQIIDKMNTIANWSYTVRPNSGGEKMAYFAKYARLLSDLQKEHIEGELVKTIKTVAQYAHTRDHYAEVARALHLLSISCDKGQTDARRLAAQIVRDNPSRPAYREEIQQYEY